MNDKRLGKIDAMKGIGIFCVVYAHVITGYDSRGMIPFNNFYRVIYDLIYSFHMPLFFSISGYLFCYSIFERYDDINKKKTKLAYKILNLLGSYIFFSILYWLFKYPFNKYMVVKYTFIDLILIIVKPIGVYWYLWILIIYYLVFGLLTEKIPQKIMLIILIIMHLLASFFKTDMPYEIYMLMWNSIVFYFGYIIKKCDLHLSDIIKIGTTFIAIISTIVIIFFYREARYIPIIGSIITSSFCVLIFLFVDVLQLDKRNILCHLGEESFVIYVFHVYICTSIPIVASFMGIGKIPVGGVMITTIISMFIPLLTANIMKKFKIFNLFFKPCKFFKA